MTRILSSVCLIVIIGCSSCGMNVLHGEGKKVTTAPQVSAFNAVDVSISLKTVINVQEGVQPSVTLRGYENIIKHIKTKVENNTLMIAYDLDDTWSIDADDIVAEITVPSITALTLSGAPDADIHGSVTGPEFKLDVSGAGSVVIDNMNVDNFESDLSGAGTLEVRGGTVKRADYEISGAGKIKAFPLQASETSASISGAANSEVTALEKLTASISGAGSIKYKGHPQVTQHISGVGSVEQVN